MRRGEIYAHATFDRQYLIVSADGLTDTGTAIVAEIVPEAPVGTRGMLAVALHLDGEPVGFVLAWRVNFVATGRLGQRVGQVSNPLMEVVDMALRTAMDL